jgi:hypothetical protein
MFDKKIVHEALKQSRFPGDRAENQDSIISLLIHDIFGGEILKTHFKYGWHFYNRIDGKLVDFARSKTVRVVEDNQFDDIPATPDETFTYFDQSEYSTFLMRFIWAFEDAIGLEKTQPGFSS